MVNSPVVVRNLCHSWTVLVLKMSLSANIRDRMFKWMNWGLTLMLYLLCSQVFLLIQIQT